MIAGILLAAGESKRMEGAFKPLLKWGTRPVIGECVHQLHDSKLDEIFVVLGHRELDIGADQKKAAAKKKPGTWMSFDHFPRPRN